MSCVSFLLFSFYKYFSHFHKFRYPFLAKESEERKTNGRGCEFRTQRLDVIETEKERAAMCTLQYFLLHGFKKSRIVQSRSKSQSYIENDIVSASSYFNAMNI